MSPLYLIPRSGRLHQTKSLCFSVARFFSEVRRYERYPCESDIFCERAQILGSQLLGQLFWSSASGCIFKCFLDFLIGRKWKAEKRQVLFTCSLGVNTSSWAHAVWFTFSYSAAVIRDVRLLVTCCLLRSHRRTAAHILPQQAPVEFTTGKH